LRAELERHGVIEAAPVPELGELVGSVRRLGGTLTVRSMGELGYAATVMRTRRWPWPRRSFRR
jgi:hypothetical protein